MIIGNEDERKKIQGQTMCTMDRPSSERCIEERQRLETVDEMQQWAHRDSWRLLRKFQPTSVETT
jgi:hypothetical protein